MLALQCWPPQALLWNRSHLQPTRRLQEERKVALVHRLDALETLRVMTCVAAFTSRYRIGEFATPNRQMLAAEEIKTSTQWALQEGWRRFAREESTSHLQRNA
jgi:hypothetical protein